MTLNDFSKWLQYNRVKNLRGSEYFPYPLCIYIYTYINKEVSSAHQACIYLILNTAKAVIL